MGIMSSSTVINQALGYLQCYSWGKLWRGVREFYPKTHASKTLTPLVKSQLLGLKALLLAGWWQAQSQADALIPALEPFKNDHLVYFCLYYVLMVKNDQPALDALKQCRPDNMPLWMRQWLKLEYLGRSSQDAKQIELVQSLLIKTSTITNLPSFVKVALLQSLAHNHVNLKFLQQLIDEQNWVESDDPLILIICLRANQIVLPVVQDRLQAANKEIAKPSYLNLLQANQLFSETKLSKALLAYDKLMPSGFADMTSLQTWLMLSTSLPEGQLGSLKRIEFAKSIAPTDLATQGTLTVYALIEHWLNGDFSEGEALLYQYNEYQYLSVNMAAKNSQALFIYLLSLRSVLKNIPELYATNNTAAANTVPNLAVNRLYTFGESDSLTLNNLHLAFENTTFVGQTHFVMGIKMYHLACPLSSYHSTLLAARLAKVPEGASLLFTLGEIDTRPDQGIWKNSHCKGEDFKPIVHETVQGYIHYLQKILGNKYPQRVILQGIPAPNYPFIGDKDPGDIPLFLAMIHYTNTVLKQAALSAGFSFLDVYGATVDPNTGRGKSELYLDGYHLTPMFYQEAWQWLESPNLTPSKG